ncbi:MAG TPA: sulfatase-like hydrolase/transferase [Steroidobacteraceae bacterium]|nr:sulfatase-like hydrolase/transferase [Steroidobacteraceae bacterium]
MSRATFRRFAFTLAALATSLAAHAESPLTGAAIPKPNFVVVLVDDLRWDDLGISGHPFAETPAIDRVAREGARFLNAFATTPLCSPSRASILTGQYAHTHGIVDNTARDAASHALPTFAIPLERAGYRTGFFGKWHMGNDDSPRPGFTEWVAMRGQGEAVDPQFNVNGTRIRESGYVTDLLTDHAVRFMRESRGQPFLVFLAHKALHPNVVQRDDGSTGAVPGQDEGFIPAPRHQGRYAKAPVPRRASAGVVPVRKPALLRPLEGVPPLGPDTATPDRDVRARLEMLLAVDESLGRIVAALEAAGTLDRTVIVVMSDHGYFYGEHDLNEERRLAYEESARIPLIVRYPPVAAAGTTPRELVQTLDLAPTVLELAGVAEATPRHGRSLLPLLRGERPDWRDAILLEYYSDTVFPRIRNMGYRAVRTDRYKYIRYLELPGMDELYDLEVDPYELDNLVGSAREETLLPYMQAHMAWLQWQTGDNLRR